MKKLLMTVMALSCFAFSSYGQKKVEKQIIGKWCNPYTYQSTGELKGFEFKRWEMLCRQYSLFGFEDLED